MSIFENLRPDREFWFWKSAKKWVVTIMLSFLFFYVFCCYHNFFNVYFGKEFRDNFYIINRYKWIYKKPQKTPNYIIAKIVTLVRATRKIIINTYWQQNTWKSPKDIERYKKTRKTKNANVVKHINIILAYGAIKKHAKRKELIWRKQKPKWCSICWQSR